MKLAPGLNGMKEMIGARVTGGGKSKSKSAKV